MAGRDGQRWVRDAGESVLAQTFADWELLVIDDGSTDETPDILCSYHSPDRRGLVMRQAPEGLIAALNRGWAAATAPLIARLDADDSTLPRRLERQVQYMEQHPQTALLGTWAMAIDESNRPSRRQLRPPTDRAALATTLARTNPYIHSSVMLRTEAARAVGGYRRAFEGAEDYDLWLRLADNHDIAILPEVLVRYRRHPGNVSLTGAVRQAFSARLARLSSEPRRKNGHDPASHLAAPPDWHGEGPDDFYAEAATLFRFLE